MPHILAYDLGTSGVKAVLYDGEGRLLASGYGKYPTFYPADGWREQRPSDWWSCIIRITKEIMDPFRGNDIAAIGVSGHSLGTIAVDGEGELLTDMTPIWSDARAEDQANFFFRKTDYQQWYETTGNGFPRHLYAIFKQMWLREKAPELYQKTDCFLGSKDYINFLLTGQKATDRSYASGSGVYDLLKERYLEEYLEQAGISGEKLPRVAGSGEIIGYVTQEAASLLGIPSGVPVVAGGVDNACMSLGAACKENGDAYASLGSSAWITVCADAPSLNFSTKTYTFAHCIAGKYLPSAGVFSSGSSLEWVISRLLVNFKKDKDVYKWLSELVRSAPAGANGLFFIPNLAGGSSFDPSPEVRGMLANLDLKHTQADVARAVYEGIALHLRCACDALGLEAAAIKKLLLVGGGAKSREWREIYASVFGVPVCRTPVTQEAAALGAALLAGVGVGIWSDYGILDRMLEDAELTYPNRAEAEFYQKILPKYKALCALTQEIAEITKGERMKNE